MVRRDGREWQIGEPMISPSDFVAASLLEVQGLFAEQEFATVRLHNPQPRHGARKGRFLRVLGSSKMIEPVPRSGQGDLAQPIQALGLFEKPEADFRVH
jgi:hypothetical protein